MPPCTCTPAWDGTHKPGCPSYELGVAELADGMALWEEHRPRSPEDWIEVARRCNHDGALRSVMNPILAALCIAVEQLDREHADGA